MYEPITIPQPVIDVILQYVWQNSEQPDFPWYMQVPMNLIKLLLSDVVDPDLIVSGYVYAHTQAIPLHVDRYNRDSQCNLCIPLWTEDADQKLIIFDQEFNEYGMTWMHDSRGFISHKPSRHQDAVLSEADNNHHRSEMLEGVRPCDTPGVRYLTDQPVAENLRPYLPIQDHDFYHGLTGHAWDWVPGNALMFRSSQLHTTGLQSKPKIGYVLLLRGPLDPTPVR